jgi:hypothetical protein
MKIGFIILAMLGMLMIISKVNISFSPFNFTVKNPLFGLGYFSIFIGIWMIQLGAKREYMNDWDCILRPMEKEATDNVEFSRKMLKEVTILRAKYKEEAPGNPPEAPGLHNKGQVSQSFGYKTEMTNPDLNILKKDE